MFKKWSKVGIYIIGFILILFCIDMFRVNISDNLLLLTKVKNSKKVFLYIENDRYSYQNFNKLNEFNKLIKYKFVRRVSFSQWESSWKNKVLTIEYPDSEEILVVDKRGSILISRDKGDIRNRSWLHYIWWRYDNLNDNHTAIYYLTPPDDKIIKIINDIKLNIHKN